MGVLLGFLKFHIVCMLEGDGNFVLTALAVK